MPLPDLILRPCRPDELPRMAALINAAAEAYRGVIPADRWHEPSMPLDELSREFKAGVMFQGAEAGGALVGVMGLQPVQDVELIRHAYTDPASQGRGVGSALLAQFRQAATGRLLVGTWAAADWAVRFYRRHGFRLVTPEQKGILLRRYWSIPERQIETSVVLEHP